MFGQAPGVALSDDSGSDAAAVGANGAIDLFFDVLGNAPQNAVGVVAIS